MRISTQFWRGFISNFTSLLPLRSYGELVLKPVTIAEQAAATEIAFSTANNKK